MDRRTSCTFTGHRVGKLPWRENEQDPRCQRLKGQISDTVRAVYHGGRTHFICGMATGCDTYFCEAVLALREEYPDITVEAAIPWERQSERWTPQQRKHYNRLVTECDSFTIISREYTDDCLIRRNRYMVDNSSVLIAAYNGCPGGTRSTMLYAMRQGLEIIEITI